MSLRNTLFVAATATAPCLAASLPTSWRRSDGSLFDQFQDILQTMQSTYWNGSYWPSTIQWEGAVLDTFLGDSVRSFLHVINDHGGTVTGSDSTSASLDDEIHRYFSQVEAYFGSEDTDQIFNAAYDDAQWVVLEWLEAIKFIQEYDASQGSSYGSGDLDKFAHRAHVFYHIVQNEFDTSQCGGGLTWNPALAVYKNAVTNELFLDTSISMYLYFPGDDNTDPYPSDDYESRFGSLPSLPTLQKHDSSLLQAAKDEYEWFKSQAFLDSQGLVIDGFHISSGQSTCDQANTMVYSYNQGILLSGLRKLWEATGDTSYLDDGYSHIWSAMNATRWFSQDGQWGGLGRYGIMEDYCDATGDCSQNAQIFKGVYFEHLDAFCTPLPTQQATIPGITHTASSSLASKHASNCADYLEWVKHNAQAALTTVADTNSVIGGWWAEDAVSQGSAQPHIPGPGVSHPGVDIWNNPDLLDQAPWACESGDPHCNKSFRHGQDSMLRAVMMKREVQQRTVETEGSGLAVVCAASDMSLSMS